ncbi:MAG: DUF5615 family PIN-like protein [Alphaproteobacteria bacterium]
MKLICDEMLIGLARWLRAAGYDTRMCPSGAEDVAVLELAAIEGRTLLTRDRQILRQAGHRHAVLLLESESLEDQARELVRRLDVDWLNAPFTRCIIDNARLRSAAVGALAKVPGTARSRGGPHRSCPSCGRVYWPGSHHRRMRARLRGWRAAGEVR